MDPKLAKSLLVVASHWEHNDGRNVGGVEEVCGEAKQDLSAVERGHAIHLRIPNRRKSHVCLLAFQHDSGELFLVFSPIIFPFSVFSYPNIHNSGSLASLFRARYYPFVFIEREERNETVKENSSRRRCFGFALEISSRGNYFTITAEGRNTCLISSSAREFFFSCFLKLLENILI